MINKEVRVVWMDAKLFSPKQQEIRLSSMQTQGMLYQETEHHYIIKDPHTINTKTGKEHPERQPTFYSIPKSMVTSVM